MCPDHSSFPNPQQYIRIRSPFWARDKLPALTRFQDALEWKEIWENIIRAHTDATELRTQPLVSYTLVNMPVGVSWCLLSQDVL